MLVSVCSKGSLKNDNSVINYSPSCCSIPLFTCKTQTKIFLIKSRAFWPSIESKGPTTIKAQKHRKDIVKIVCVTSMVQLWFCEATRILFVRKENKNNYLIQQFLLFHVSLHHAFTTHVVCKGFWCRTSANHRLLGALRRTGGGGGGWGIGGLACVVEMKEWMQFVFHAVSNRGRGKCSYLLRMLRLWVFFSSKRLYDIHVT